MNSYVLGGLILATLFNISLQQACPLGFVMLDSRCYLFSKESVSWQQAWAECATLDRSQLVSIESVQEHNALVAHIASLSKETRPYWTSGKKKGAKGFVWMSTGGRARYTNWCSGSPQVVGGGDTIQLLVDPQEKCWIDTPEMQGCSTCYSLSRFICEKDMKSFK